MANHPHYLWANLFRKGESDKSNILQILKENILFETLNPRELKAMSSLVYERVYEVNEPIFHQNDRGFGMYLIARGKVAIRTHSGAGDILVTTLSAGSFFGELSLVETNNIRTASAIAIEQTMCIGFFKPDLLELLERRPAMGVKILYQLSIILGRRLVETTDKITLLNQNKGIHKAHDEIL